MTGGIVSEASQPGSCTGRGFKRDGVTCSEFTAKLFGVVSANFGSDDFLEMYKTCPKSFAPDNSQLFLLSDGRCGSTCSMFSRALQDE